MAAHVRQIIPADGWFAVYARASGPVRENTSGVPRPSMAVGLQRASGPAPEFVPLVAWALVVDESGTEAERIIGVLVHGNVSTELVMSDDPSFLGYAGPSDPGVERVGLTPDWRALARQAIAELKAGSRAMPTT